MLVVLLGVLGATRVCRGGPAQTTQNIDTANAQYDWSQMIWIVNTTDRVFHVL